MKIITSLLLSAIILFPVIALGEPSCPSNQYCAEADWIRLYKTECDYVDCMFECKFYFNGEEKRNCEHSGCSCSWEVSKCLKCLPNGTPYTPGNPTTNKLKMERWATKQGGFWDKQKWFTGDFNNDGYTDFAKAFEDNHNASIDVHLSNGNSFRMERWATRQGGFWHNQKWVTGDFNNDGYTDFAKAFEDNHNASIDVHLSNGNKFRMERWATRQGGFWDKQRWVAGDFNGDGYIDMAKAFADADRASIDVHISTGYGFYMVRWATRLGSFSDGQKWLAADYNGDGLTDIARVTNDGKKATIDVYISMGNSFEKRRWATRQGARRKEQHWVAGDFNGDGLSDIAKAFRDDLKTSIDVHLSTGDGFIMQRWATRQGGYSDNNHKWATGDFDNNGLTDFIKAFKHSDKASIDVHRLQ